MSFSSDGEGGDLAVSPARMESSLVAGTPASVFSTPMAAPSSEAAAVSTSTSTVQDGNVGGGLVGGTPAVTAGNSPASGGVVGGLPNPAATSTPAPFTSVTIGGGAAVGAGGGGDITLSTPAAALKAKVNLRAQRDSGSCPFNHHVGAAGTFIFLFFLSFHFLPSFPFISSHSLPTCLMRTLL